MNHTKAQLSIQGTWTAAALRHVYLMLKEHLDLHMANQAALPSSTPHLACSSQLSLHRSYNHALCYPGLLSRCSRQGLWYLTEPA